MSRFSEDSFLCNDCQELGYCRLRAMQAEAERRAMWEKAADLAFRQQTSFQYPMLSADSEPMPTFREFVAVHRPDLSKHLPKPADAEPGLTSGKRPSLAELRANIAARKLSASPNTPAEEQLPIIEKQDKTKQEHIPVALSIPENVATPKSATVALPKTSAVRPRSRNLRFSIDLRRFPHHSIDKRILPPSPHSTIFWSVDNRTSLTSFSSLEI